MPSILKCQIVCKRSSVNSTAPEARGSQEAGFTQPHTDKFALQSNEFMHSLDVRGMTKLQLVQRRRRRHGHSGRRRRRRRRGSGRRGGHHDQGRKKEGLSSRSRRAISASLVHATWRGNFAPLKQREHLRSTTDVAPNLIGRTFILPVDPLE